MNYTDFIHNLDSRLELYFKEQKNFICCKKQCSACCEKGDYPLSQYELEYLMEGYSNLETSLKIKVQENFKKFKKGGKCPFLIDKTCSVYNWRPIICRVHGLAYICPTGEAKLPYCANEGKNYSKVYSSKELFCEPIKENLDTKNLLKDFPDVVIKNLYDWLNYN